MEQEQEQDLYLIHLKLQNHRSTPHPNTGQCNKTNTDSNKVTKASISKSNNTKISEPRVK